MLQSAGELSVTAVFCFLESSWENLNMSIITEDWLLGSTDTFLSFLPPSPFPPHSLQVSLPFFHLWHKRRSGFPTLVLTCTLGNSSF